MKSTSFHVRHAGPEDLPKLLDLYQHLTEGDERPTLKAAAEILDLLCAYQGSAIFVGYLGDVLVTSCTLIVVPNLTRGGSPYGLIENVVTRSDVRRQGLGKRMLAIASEAAWKAGCYKVMLMTGSQAAGTLNFYVEAGFDQSKTGFQKRRIPARHGG
jgi:GNAT superfamily N-acetyltransferase